MKVAFIMSRFPCLTETFVAYEIVALERLGVETSVYPLLRTPEPTIHPEVEAIVKRAHYQPFVSLPILAANLRLFWRQPRAYLSVLSEVLRGTWGSANFFLGAVGIFPKTVLFAHEMLEEGVTHVHAHFSNHPTVAALIVHRLTGIPFSFTAHGHDIHIERRMLKEKIDAASFSVMISEYNRRLVLDECPGTVAEKLHLIHCGVDTEFFAPRASRDEDRPISLICVGSFVEVKGHRYLVEACRLLKERRLAFICRLVGEGRDLPEIEKQVQEAGLQDQVVFLGPQTRLEVAQQLADSDVVVQPSVPTKRGAREGIPVSLMEGMACELAVVASGISGIPELVVDEQTGYLVPPRDAEALANALERLIRNPGEAKRLGRAGRTRVLENFDQLRNADRLVELIRQARGSRSTELRGAAGAGAS